MRRAAARASLALWRLTAAASPVPVSEDGKRVKRTKQLVEGEEDLINKAVEARSLYASPFPMNSSLDGARGLLGEVSVA